MNCICLILNEIDGLINEISPKVEMTHSENVLINSA
jgi:hypothetical protein